MVASMKSVPFESFAEQEIQARDLIAFLADLADPAAADPSLTGFSFNELLVRAGPQWSGLRPHPRRRVVVS